MSDEEKQEELSTEELLEQYEEEKKKFRERTSNKERYTGNELFNMKNAIQGLQITPQGQVRKTSGIGDLKGDKHASFKSKVSRNLQIIQNELQIVRGLVPELKESEKKRHEEFQDKKEELQEENIGTEASRRKNLSTQEKIELSGNKKIYEAGLEKLKEEYKDVLDRVEEINETAEKIFEKPICKCDFDLINQDEIPPEVSPNERQMIWPMIFTVEQKDPEDVEPSNNGKKKSKKEDK